MTLVHVYFQILESSIDKFNELECDVPLPIFRMAILRNLAMGLFKPIATKYQSNTYIKNRGFPISFTFSFLMIF